MEFLKTCTTNAQAIGDFEAIAYQAISVTRTANTTTTSTTSPQSSKQPPPSSSPSEDTRAVEAELRHALHLVAHDAARPWLWLFKPTTVDKLGQASPQLPELGGYRLQREHTGAIKAIDLVPATSNHPPSTNAPQRGLQSGNNPRPAQGSTQPQPSADPPPPPDCFTLYELFTSSVVALISFHVVKDCQVVALNYRTFVSKASKCIADAQTEVDPQPEVHRLTSINVHWASSGTLLLSTFTDRKNTIRCLTSVSTQTEERQLVGTCIRVAPNGVLATIMSFEDPLDSINEEISIRHRKRTKLTSLEQNIEKWKSSVKRWLGWKGYDLPDLDQRTSWVRIRTTLMSSPILSSPASVGPERDTLWPRALCFFHVVDEPDLTITGTNTIGAAGNSNILRWFETPESMEWFLGKPDRDKILEARKKAKKAEEDAVRRKEEHPGLHPSSPLNARGGTYGDLQAVSGVYPTPPDGIAPGTGVSYSDTPTVSGTASNVVLVAGGSNPAINLSAPPDSAKTEDQQMITTSPAVPSATDNFNTSSDGYTGDRINDTDFDFFDGPDNDDVDMLDAPALPNDNAPPTHATQDLHPKAATEPQAQDDMSDPFAALENALDLAKGKEPAHMPAPKIEISDNAGDNQSAPTPPLSPSKILKALEPSPPRKSASRTRSERGSESHPDAHFTPVYQGGRFSAHRPTTPTGQVQLSPSPARNTAATQPKSLREFPLLSKLRLAAGIASANRIPEIASLARAASDDSDSSSEASDASGNDSGDEEVEVTPAAIMNSLSMPAKRKLQSEGNATPLSVTSFAESLGDEVNLSSFEPSLWDWSLVNVPSPAERPVAGARYSLPTLLPGPAQMPDTPTSQPDPAYEVPDEKPLSAKDSISITQIVTDQLVSTTLDMLSEDPPIRSEFNNDAVAETPWYKVIKNLFPTATDCDLPTLAGVNEVFQDYAALAKAQQRPPARKSDSPAVTGSHMYQIQAPFLRVRRAETHWDLLPPAVAFWETLGLSPISHPKNIVTFCVYPHSDAIRPCLESFLLNLQLAYDGCKLGNHSRVETAVEYEGGLVPVRATSTIAPRETFKLLKDTCVQLGKLLALQYGQIREQQDSKVDAFVIYIIDPFGGSSAVWELCSAFWALFQAYTQGHPGRPDQPQKPDVVLQIIPMKYVASFDAPVILDPSTYMGLAREVYDRCPPSAPSGDKTSLSIYKAPAFHLEETLPRNIPFKLISEPAQDLLRENTYMHLGYAISLDGAWVTAAWTDSCGKSQAVVSYYLGTRMFREIAKEIWQTTIEILQSRRVNWRVCIAKAGVLEREELETWVFLISCPTQINVFVTLLTAVDTDPPYQFTPTVPNPTPATGAGATTPGSTPQAGVSPSDPGPGLTPAATPAADPTATDPAADPEARLIDVTDDTWGIILAHRLHNSHTTTQFSPALISGLLVKRGETLQTSNSIAHPIPDPEQGPIVIAVNFLWIGAVGSSRNATTNLPFPSSTSSSANAPASSISSSDLPSPGGSNLPNPYANNPGTPQSPGPGQEGQRSTTSLMWTPTPQTRTTAEGLLKEVLGQFRALGLLAKLRGMRGTRNGTIPWHVAAAKRGVEGLSKISGGAGTAV
ncbi:mediator complex subunit 13 C-terminal-domain-containing protein [Bipolaris maydis]|uniref:mediator complex subunit 13 C-terminal-domain-containing protein n=1 Tax=Cochliobolus heterostrophus TaxID=5016 RepID=UPI0024DD718D|nr:mediator complex subunit 13 C-terminal-domain-containing protein [Bipolaris maydis]KAJ6272962.1 mediator complex subunit 13 C-terminal-domain-containing protein [Bipolaris maydis]